MPSVSGSAYYPMALFLLMGANGAFITGDLFNLYVFYEVLLMSSFVLLTLGGTPSQINGGIRYVVLNLMGSMMLLLAAGITYGTLGTLNMAHIAERMGEAPYLVQAVIAGLLLDRLWRPRLPSSRSSSGCPAAITRPIRPSPRSSSGVLTKVGIYSLFRTFPLFFPDLLDRRGSRFIMTIAGLDDGDRRAGRLCPADDSPPVELSHHQPDRLHAHGPGRGHGADARMASASAWRWPSSSSCTTRLSRRRC